ncbi:MAG: T9SS type A sorting domain-containing protein [bacterium]
MKTKLRLIILLLVFIMNASLVDSQWSSNPQVNSQICDIKQKQTIPKVAATSDGGFFISWFDLRGNNSYKVYLQRLNAQGVKQFATDGLLISDHPQNTWFGDYDLEVDGSDNAILVFSDIRNSGTDTIANPFAYKISSTGQFLWGPNGVTLTSMTLSYQVWPKVASLSDGSTIVVWWFINTPQRNSWITMQRLNSAGVPQFANPINIQDPGGKRYQYPDVCAADNGNYILSWVYGPKDTVGSFVPDNISIFTGKYNSSGNTVWNSQTLVYNNSGNQVPIYSVPRIYPDGNGGALYSFFTLEGTILTARAQRFNSAGVALFPVNGSEGSTNHNFEHVDPYLAYMSSTNETYIFWTQADAATQDHQAIYGQGFSSTGTRLWGNDGKGFTALDTLSIYGISCFAKDTNIVATYTTASFVTANIYGFRVGRSGVYNWSPAHVTMCDATSPKGFITSAMTPSGMVAGVWVDGRNSSTFGSGGIYAQNLKYDGTIGSVGITQISSNIPEGYSLKQNYPNPFNNSTVIEFEINNSDNYKFEIFDMLGKKVDEVFNNHKTPGTYKVNYNADKLSSGIYLYRLSSDELNLSKKFILVK